MSDFTDLRGRQFNHVDMAGTGFTSVLLKGASFRSCEFDGVVMRDVEMVDTTIEGEIRNLVINGVDVTPLVEAELDRRNPDRPKFRPTTAEGFRRAWDLNERLWESTVARARRLAPELLHESVAEEWSFIQTLRHLAFATQSWVGRCILGHPSPWHPRSLPWSQMQPRPGVPQARECAPVARRGARVAAGGDGDDAAGGRRPDRRAARQPDRAVGGPRLAGRGVQRSKSANACWSCSTRSGSTAGTPSGIRLCWRNETDLVQPSSVRPIARPRNRSISGALPFELTVLADRLERRDPDGGRAAGSVQPPDADHPAVADHGGLDDPSDVHLGMQRRVEHRGSGPR